ncbi:MAG: HEAT repeat domain-containing protein [Armatimonadota bacterium]|nr:HEAT repeat domain-containing protein [Armatimonadota bacterium]
MKSTRRRATKGGLTLLIAGAAVLAPAIGLAQNDPFVQLGSYDSQDRTAVLAIRGLIDAAGTDRTKLAPIEDHLIGVLGNPVATFAGKQEASRLLWMVGTDRSSPILAQMLKDEKLNNIARYALERSPSPGASKVLRSALVGATGPALIGIINTLGDRRDPDAVGALRSFTTNADPLVQEAATTALGKIGTDSAVRALKGEPAGNMLVNEALLRAAERMAASPNGHGKAEALYLSLAEQGRPPVVQAGALAGLAAMGSPRAGSVALLGLKSPDGLFQSEAARIAGTIADPRMTQEAMAAWPTLPALSQTVMLAAFANRNATAATPLALQAMGSTDPLLRTTGILAAGRIGGAGVVPQLAELASHGDADGQTARDALSRMPGPGVEDALLDAVTHGKPEVRGALMGVLAERPSPAVMSTLLQLASGTDPGVAVQSLKGLGAAGGPAERTAILKLLVGTPNDDVRDAAKDAVVGISQRLGDTDTASTQLVDAFAGAPTPAKIALLSALSETGGNGALTELTRAASDTDPQIKTAAITDLANSWSDSRPLPTLLDTAKNDPTKSLRVQALRGYLRLVGQDAGMTPEDKVARLGQALAAAERPEEKTQVLSILRDIRIPQSVDMAAKLLDDPALTNEAASTVIYLAGPQKKNNQDQAAVKGAGTTTALDKIIASTKDDNLKAQAQKVR